MPTRVSVRGLGSSGVSSLDLPAGVTSAGATAPNPAKLSTLHARITAISDIPAEQQLLFVNGQTLFAKDASRTLQSCGIVNGSEIHFMRNIASRNYPSMRLRLSVWKDRIVKYVGGALATLSAAAVLWQTVAGAETLKSALPLSDSLLAPMTSFSMPIFIFFASCLGAAVNLGHWIAGFPILPAALFTLVSKGAKQNEQFRDGSGSSSSALLNKMEMRLAEIVVRYAPNLLSEASNIITAAQRGVVKIHQLYGGTRLRLMCADGVAIDGMHVLPIGRSGSASEPLKQSKRRCLIVVNGNAEFYELDGLQHQSHSNSSRYRQQGFHVLMFNYRGVGVSEGFPTRDGLLLDLHAVVDFAMRPEPYGLGVAPNRIVVCGRSLGGAVSTILLSEMSPLPLILCNTRSFSKLSSTANLLLGQQYGLRIGSLASLGIGILGWELDALKVWTSIPGFKWFETVSDDDIILAGAKLSDGIDGLRGQGSAGILLTERDLRRVELLASAGASSHNRMLFANEYRMRNDMINEAIKESQLEPNVYTKKTN